jgi:hypothetical protein
MQNSLTKAKLHISSARDEMRSRIRRMPVTINHYDDHHNTEAPRTHGKWFMEGSRNDADEPNHKSSMNRQYENQKSK